MEQNWNTLLGSVADANQKAITAATEFNQIALRAQARLARRQFAAFEDCLDAGSEHLAVATSGTEPQQILSKHAEIVASLGEKLVAASQEAWEIQVEARDELARWMEDGMSQITPEAAEVVARTPAARKPRRASTKSA